MVCPLIGAESSLHRKRRIFAMSRSEHVPTASVECFAVDACIAFAAFVYLPLAFIARWVIGVMTVPGHTQFARIFCSPFAKRRAICLVSEISAPLETV